MRHQARISGKWKKSNARKDNKLSELLYLKEVSPSQLSRACWMTILTNWWLLGGQTQNRETESSAVLPGCPGSLLMLLTFSTSSELNLCTKPGPKNVNNCSKRRTPTPFGFHRLVSLTGRCINISAVHQVFRSSLKGHICKLPALRIRRIMMLTRAHRLHGAGWHVARGLCCSVD